MREGYMEQDVTKRLMLLFSLGCLIFSLACIIYSFAQGFDAWVGVYRPTYGAVAASAALTAVFAFLAWRATTTLSKRLFVVLSSGFGVLSVTGLLLHFRWDQVGLLVVIAFSGWVVILTTMAVTGVLTLTASGKRGG